jgi:hypothetical protein
MPEGHGDWKLTLIANVSERLYQPYGLLTNVRSIAFSANGAMIA